MGKRTVFECDLCKGEFDPEDSYSITVKKKGKTKGNAFDLCPPCAETIQQQLVAQSSEALSEGWSFGVSAPVVEHTPRVRGQRRQEVTEQQVDDDLIARKEAERLGATGAVKEPEQADLPYETVEPTPLDDGSCPHMNKGRIMADESAQDFYQQCKDCGQRIKITSSTERASALSASAGQGVRLSTHGSENRRRD